MLAGPSEFGARLLSVLFSVAIVAWTYALATRLFDRRVGLVTAILLAVSPFHVEFAQEARMYALLALAAVASMHAFVTWFQRVGVGWFLLYVAATTVMLYTHVYSVFMLGAQVVILVWWRNRPGGRRARLAWVAAQPVVLLLYSPWLVALAEQVARVQAAFWIPRPMVIQVLQPLWTYSGSIPLTAVLVPLAGFGVFRLWQGTRSDSSGALPLRIVIAWLATPIVLPFAISFVSAPIFLPKYTIAASVPFFMLVAAGVVHLPRTHASRWIVGAVVVLLVGRFGWYYATHDKDGWRDAVATLETAAAPGDAIVFYPWFHQVPFTYYQRRTDLRHLTFVDEPDDPAPPPADLPRLAARAVDGKRRLWLVTLQGEPMKPLIAAELGRRMTLARRTTRQHIDLYLFEQR
jgi:uncharacterized membrane protein